MSLLYKIVVEQNDKFPLFNMITTRIIVQHIEANLAFDGNLIQVYKKKNY